MANKLKGIVISAHPYQGSFGAAVANQATTLLKAKGLDVTEFNLVVDGYEPAEYETKNKTQVALVKKYKKALLEADEVVIEFPRWWSSGPALLEGFYEQVLTEGDFYTVVDNKISPVEHNIKTVSIFSTAFTPTIIDWLVLGQPTKNKAVAMWKALGVENVKFKTLERVTASRWRTETFIKKMEKVIGGNK